MPGGVIDRLADGKTPSGVLRDNAMSLVGRLIPEPDEAEILEAVLAAQKHAAELGVTSIQDMDGSSPETRRRLFRVLQRLAREDKLTCRIDLRWPIGAPSRTRSTPASTADFGNDFVRIGGVKGFMDGSLGTSTAKMFDPYESDAKTTGVYVTEPDTMRALIRSADAAGLNVCVHAIGDQANAVLLDLFAEVAEAERRARPALPHRTRPAPAPGRLPALQGTRRGRVDAAVSRHRRRPLGRGAHRREALCEFVRLSLAARRRGEARVRLRLAGRAARSDCRASTRP